jgi:group II intron reverse transcriptase/maturase
MAKTVRELQRVLGQAAKDEVSRKFHSLYDKVCRKDVIWSAWLAVKANDGSGGVDGKELRDYEDPIERTKLLREIHRELLEGTYRAQPVRREHMEKPDGGKRPLGIPTIKDRIVQTAVKLVIEPIFEADFQEFSYGFRAGKSSHQALQAVWKWMNFGYNYVVDADIHKYFDTIPHDKLLQSVSRRVIDGRILRLIRMWLKAPISDGDRLVKNRKGTPQGGVISPLLANIYLNHLDRFWVKKGYERCAKLVRYADDFVILCENHPEFYHGEARRLLENLELEISEQKTRIVEANKQGVDFLGFHIRRVWAYRPKQKRFGWVTGVRLSRHVLKKARREINNIVGKGGRKSPVPLQVLVNSVNHWIKHWLPYYSYANHHRDIQYLYKKIILERLTRGHIARCQGRKPRGGKWKSWNPKYWEGDYGLINVPWAYYQRNALT